MNWNILILSLSLILLVFLLWKEITRRNRLSFTARIVATIVAVVSLALIALPVSVKRSRPMADASAAIVLTEGFHTDSIKKFVKENPGIKIFTVDKKIKFDNAAFIPDINQLSSSPSGISTLHVFGHGLTDLDLKRINNMNLVYHPNPILNRITAVDWQQNIASGEEMVVQGKMNNANEHPLKIVLTGFNTTLDSAMLPAGQHASFQLTTFPKHIDKAVYTVTVLSDGDTVETNPLPVDVSIVKPMNILLLASSPDFDNKFLKNWLTENGYGFAARTYISKNKYERQYVNVNSVSISRITSSLLDKFDVVIADVAELNAMPATDVANLRSYIENKGFGLIVKAAALPRASGFYLASFPLAETRDSIQHTVKLHARNISIPSSLRIKQPVYIVNRPGTSPLLTDQHTRTLASSKMFGLGKVIVTTIPNSYAWWLAGNKDDYASYWTILLNKAAKKIVYENAWEHSTHFPRKDLEMNIRLQTLSDSIPRLQVSNESMYPSQNPYLPYEWSGRYWPTRAGWHAVTGDDKSVSWIYVYDNSDWQGVTAGEKIIATKKYAVVTSKVNERKVDNIVSIEIPRIYFFLLFIVSAAFLWFEKKYRNG